jgi:dipeptidyl aminopeptidase/acylaminoacyl peptidase
MLLRSILLSMAILASVPQTSHANDKAIPVENFVLEDQYAQPKLSPDGKYLAITVRLPLNDRFVPTIVVYSLPEMKEQGAVRMPVFEVPGSYTWVSNTRLLVTKAKEVGSAERPMGTGEIFAMDFDGQNQLYLYGYNMRMTRLAGKYDDNFGTGYIAGLPKEKNGHFYMTTHLWQGERSMLYDVDSKNGNRKLIASIAAVNASFVIQNNGTPRFAFGSDINNFEVLYKFDDTSNDWKLVSKEENQGYIRPFAFSDDDTEFYAFYRKANEPYKIIKQNVATGERTVLLENGIGELDLMMFGSQSDLPFLMASSVGIPKPFYLTPNTVEAKQHQLLSSKFPGNFVSFINYTDDGKKLLFSVTSDREPGSFFIFDKTTGRAYPLFANRQALDPDQMSERRPITYTSRDGVKIHGYLTVPKDHNPAKKMPLIVLPHGGPHGPADHWFFDNDAQFLASRGYAVLQVNFRGSGGKGQAFERSGYLKWGSDIQNDILDGVQWAIKEANVDSNRMCTFGASFGGYSALMLTVREPEMFKCAIGYVGVYDLNLMYGSDEARNPRFKATMMRYIGTDKEQLDAFSPAKHAEKIKVPVFLAHGMDDTRATFNHAEAMRAALIKVGRPPEWMAVPNEGHGFYNTKNRKEFYERLETFLAKHLGQ